jgi:hypothetical protein
MQGNVSYQVRTVFESIKDFKSSRHEDKEQARSGGAKTFHEVSKETKLNSYSTADSYRDVSKQMFTYVKEEFGLRDLTQIQSFQVEKWLDNVIDKTGERATFDKYASAMEKLEVALNQHAIDKGIVREYKFDLAQVRLTASHELGKRSHDSRAYADPRGLADAVPGKYNLLANIIHDSGCRINEGHHVREHQLKGLHPDPHTGDLKGIFTAQVKGGKKDHEFRVSPATYTRLVAAVKDGGGLFHTNKNNYRNKLESAAQKTGQRYEGPHGQRWSFCQTRMTELQVRAGYTLEMALGIVSLEMSHIRATITEHYMK